ncbi:MAG: ATP-binding protein [Dehalococcoidia bacterium]
MLALALVGLGLVVATLVGGLPGAMIAAGLLATLVGAVLVEVVYRYGCRSLRRIATANSLVLSLASSWHLPDAYRRALAAVVCGLGAKGGVLAWLDEEKGVLSPVASRGLPPEWLDEASGRQLEGGPLAAAVASGRPTFEGAALAESWFGHGVVAGDKDTVVYVPLRSRQRAIAVMALLCEGTAADLQDGELLTTIGVAAGVALDNARMHQGERRQTRQLLDLTQERTRLLTNIVHELRIPLTSVKAAAHMLCEEMGECDGPPGRLTRNIYRGAERLDALITDLAEMARLESASLRLEPGPTVVQEVLEAVVGLMQPLLDSRRQRLEADVAAGTPRVIVVDRRRFEQILVNLLANAYRYTPRDGVIRVSIRQRGDSLVVAVSDEGPGVPPAQREAIFEPFYRGDGASSLRSRGMGLGLAIAKSLAEMHGGRLWLESDDGQGSTFYLSLPIVGNPALALN